MVSLQGRGNSVLTIKPAKSVQGKFELPASPDLFLLTLATAMAAKVPTEIKIGQKTPLIESYCSIFSTHLKISLDGELCKTEPLEDPAVLIVFPSSDFSYRDSIIFTALGAGKVVGFRKISDKRLDYFIELGKRIGIMLEKSQQGDLQTLFFVHGSNVNLQAICEENDISGFLGYLLGSKQVHSFQIDYHLLHPLRNLIPIFGYSFQVKSAAPVKDTDPLARRIRMMQAKKNKGNSPSQTFTVTSDFPVQQTTESVKITLPGDEILGSILLCSKIIVVKGSLVISNFLLEPWACQFSTFIRRMGTKLSIQETERSSFGSIGLVSLQKTELIGRKVECVPLYQFKYQVPAMIVAASYSEAQSVFRNLEDLRLDTPDEIDLMEQCIRRLGAHHGEMPDGIVMEGGRDLDGFDLQEDLHAATSGAFAIAALRCQGTTNIADSLILERWPDFHKLIETLCEFRA